MINLYPIGGNTYNNVTGIEREEPVFKLLYLNTKYYIISQGLFLVDVYVQE